MDLSTNQAMMNIKDDKANRKSTNEALKDWFLSLRRAYRDSIASNQYLPSGAGMVLIIDS